MKTLAHDAATSRERIAFWAPHPIELAIIALFTALAHFVWRESWGEGLWSAAIAFSLLPRGEIWDSNGNWQWSWLVLRWPSITEVLLAVIAAFWFYRSGDSFWLTAAQVAAVLLGARVLAALADHVAYKFPPGERARKITNWVCGLVALALVAQLLWTVDWREVAQGRPNFDTMRNYRPDWSGAAWILWMGTIAVLFVGPPLELWNRALKPFDRRADLAVLQRTSAALAYIAACCIWWAVLVLATGFIFSQPNLWN